MPAELLPCGSVSPLAFRNGNKETPPGRCAIVLLASGCSRVYHDGALSGVTGITHRHDHHRGPTDEESIVWLRRLAVRGAATRERTVSRHREASYAYGAGKRGLIMTDSEFLPGGWTRARAGAADEIEGIRRRITAAVEAKYEQRLAGAGPFRRLWLRTMMAREIRYQLDAEVEKIAPSDGLYLRSLPEKRGKRQP